MTRGAIGKLGKRRYVSHVNILDTDHPVTTDLVSHLVSVRKGWGAAYVFGFEVHNGTVIRARRALGRGGGPALRPKGCSALPSSPCGRMS